MQGFSALAKDKRRGKFKKEGNEVACNAKSV